MANLILAQACPYCNAPVRERIGQMPGAVQVHFTCGTSVSRESTGRLKWKLRQACLDETPIGKIRPKPDETVEFGDIPLGLPFGMNPARPKEKLTQPALAAFDQAPKIPVILDLASYRRATGSSIRNLLIQKAFFEESQMEQDFVESDNSHLNQVRWPIGAEGLSLDVPLGDLAFCSECHNRTALVDLSRFGMCGACEAGQAE